MFFKIANRAVSVYKDTVSSIGFIPTLISVCCGLLAIGILAIDTNKATAYLLDHAPLVVIRDGDTARVILSTMVGGLVSLTVFSFTMVMAQLNRAASNYSPRLLPGLISTRSHQVVLGIFLGAITFCLIVLISVEPGDDSYQLPGLAILVAVIFGLGSLGLFVYFIHRISLAIQITNILERVSSETARRLTRLDEEKEERHVGQTSNSGFESAKSIRAEFSGYYHGCNVEPLVTLAQGNDLVIEVLPVQGLFVLEGTTVVNVGSEIDEETAEKILACLRYSRNDLVEDNYVLGFKQICEIAVRAMSPGTNDPGTAMNAIDHLTKLFGLRMRIDDEEEYSDENGDVRLMLNVVDFSELLYLLCSSLRLYCKHDVVIVLKLLQMFDYLLQIPAELDSHHEAVAREFRNLINDAEVSIENKADLKAVRDFAGKVGESPHGEILSESEG